MKGHLKKIKMLVFDVDGVMTDGRIVMGSDGYEQVEFSVLDGVGITIAKRAGYIIAFITGRNSSIIVDRAKYLGIEDVFINQFHKITAYERLKEKHGLTNEEIAYMGDDILDIPLLKMAGFPVSVPHASDEVKKFAKYITKKEGGSGAVREFIDLILRETGKLDSVLEELFKEGEV